MRRPSASLRGALGVRIGQMLGSTGKAREPYRPKFCRTRKCTLPFEHSGACNNRPVSVTRVLRPVPRRRLSFIAPTPRKSPHGAPVPGAREHMAAIRAGDPVRRAESHQRNVERQLRKLRARTAENRRRLAAAK